MTYPGQGWPGQPQPGEQPGGWGQQPHQPGQQPPAGWGQQQPQQPGGYPQPPYQGQQPAYPGQPTYPGQPPYPGPPPLPGQPAMQYPVEQGQYWQPPAPKKRRNGLIVGVVVAVVVAAGAGVGTWFAFNHSGSTGAASPRDAATKLMSDIGNDDLIGVVNDLPPAEAGLFQDVIQGATDQLKRLQVVKPNASVQDMTSLQVHTGGITFDNAAAERVNDHVTIEKLVSGTITVGTNVSTNAYTESFLNEAFPNGLPKDQSHTINIADEVRRMGHPVRIATVQVDGKWYPSLFYTIADAGLRSAHEQWPSTSIAPIGAGSADEAVRAFVQAALDANVDQVIARTAPDEMAALHDVGPALVSAAGRPEPTGVHILSMRFDDRDVAGGTDTVLRSMTMTADGDQITLTQNGGCYSVHGSRPGEDQRLCASQLTQQIESGDDTFLPPQLTKLIDDMVTGMMAKGVGVVATEVDGQWYVSPGRTIAQLVLDMYGSITPDDLAAILKLGSH